MASIIIKSSTREYPKDAAEPRATSVSMLGAPCLKDPNPDVKNLPLMTMMIRARRSSRSPRATWFSKISGTGHPHIMCPMLKYMRTMRKTAEVISLFLSLGVSVSLSASSSALSFSDELTVFCAPAPLTEAP